MSSLISKQPKDTKKQTTVSLSGSVLSDLELYCQFIDSARDWVINEALKSIFHRDKTFQEWKERHASPLAVNGHVEDRKSHRPEPPKPPSAA
jgi:hypothetical protein